MNEIERETFLTPTLSLWGKARARRGGGAAFRHGAAAAQRSLPLPAGERVGVKGFSLAASTEGAC